MSGCGYNTVLSYTNGLAHVPYNLSAATLAGVRAFLDAAHARSVMVLLSLKDYYADTVHAGVDAERLWRGIVAAFAAHPALLGWYIFDEVKTRDLAKVAARYEQLEHADPNHIIYALLDNALTSTAASHPAYT